MIADRDSAELARLKRLADGADLWPRRYKPPPDQRIIALIVRILLDQLALQCLSFFRSHGEHILPSLLNVNTPGADQQLS